jgi:hypothetical protein
MVPLVSYQTVIRRWVAKRVAQTAPESFAVVTLFLPETGTFRDAFAYLEQASTRSRKTVVRNTWNRLLDGRTCGQEGRVLPMERQAEESPSTKFDLKGPEAEGVAQYVPAVQEIGKRAEALLLD